MRDVGRTRKEFVNQEPQASGLRILRETSPIETCGLLLDRSWMIDERRDLTRQGLFSRGRD